MKHYIYKLKDVCPEKLEFDLDENDCIHNLTFFGGCEGNLKAIARLLEGKKRQEIIMVLKGNTCGFNNTSCADKLARSLESIIE